MQEFKNATSNLKPRYRGRHLSNDDFIRPIHNSFVRYALSASEYRGGRHADLDQRKIDVLNADLALSNEYKESKKKKAPRKKATPKKGSKPKPRADDDAGFHFVAYVPVRGEVWRLDGLQRNPLNLGECHLRFLPVLTLCCCMIRHHYIVLLFPACRRHLESI